MDEKPEDILISIKDLIKEKQKEWIKLMTGEEEEQKA